MSTSQENEEMLDCLSLREAISRLLGDEIMQDWAIARPTTWRLYQELLRSTQPVQIVQILELPSKSDTVLEDQFRLSQAIVAHWYPHHSSDDELRILKYATVILLEKDRRQRRNHRTITFGRNDLPESLRESATA